MSKIQIGSLIALSVPGTRGTVTAVTQRTENMGEASPRPPGAYNLSISIDL